MMMMVDRYDDDDEDADVDDDAVPYPIARVIQSPTNGYSTEFWPIPRSAAAHYRQYAISIVRLECVPIFSYDDYSMRRMNRM